MPVYDFNNSPTGSKEPVCTYTIFYTNESEASAEHPLLVLDNSAGQLKHHSNGVFTNPIRRTAFEFQGEDGTVSADILRIDARFVSLLKWMGENHSMCASPARHRMESTLYIRSVRSLSEAV